MKLSKFAKQFKFNDTIAYYNSLRMKPVYLTQNENIELSNYLSGKTQIINKELFNTLNEYKILVNSTEEDDNMLLKVRNTVTEPYINVAYFVLSEQCNMACKYCFLGNNKMTSNKVTNYPMTKEIALAALKYFAAQTRNNKFYFNERKEIIFYGGEPLLNFETLVYIINQCKIMQLNGDISPNINFSMVTNGLLLDAEKINFLKEHDINISISIDGLDEQSNANRIDKNGNSVYQRIIETIELLNKMDMSFGLSITLTNEAMTSVHKTIELAKKYNISNISFNILYQTKELRLNDDYYKKATEFIIEFYKLARENCIYEDRIMRKIKAFSNEEFYFFDCAATSANQIVITPDGGVGICHGCMEHRKYFLSNVFEPSVDICMNETFKSWQTFSPIYKEQCLDCECLGLCGGGCAINAGILNSKNINTIIDRGFCIFAKSILKFMIYDLYNIMLKEGYSNAK